MGELYFDDKIPFQMKNKMFQVPHYKIQWLLCTHLQATLWIWRTAIFLVKYILGKPNKLLICYMLHICFGMYSFIL